MKKNILLIALLPTTSFNLLTAQTINPAPYCIANFDDAPFNVPDAIKSVSFGTLTNITNAQYAFPHYVFYNNLATPNVIKGSTYPLTAIFEVNGGCGYSVWIDYNHNNVFETSEKVSGTPIGTSLNITPNTTITENITIPTSAMLGNTRMRVRIVEDDTYTFGANGYSIQPCNASTSSTDVMDWGETEDCTINITAPLGINEIAATTDFIIYPNPVTTGLTLNEDITNNTTYKIVSITGQVLQSGVLTTAQKQINVSSLSEGIYFLQLGDNKTIRQQKFIKTTNH